MNEEDYYVEESGGGNGGRKRPMAKYAIIFFILCIIGIVAAIAVRSVFVGRNNGEKGGSNSGSEVYSSSEYKSNSQEDIYIDVGKIETESSKSEEEKVSETASSSEKISSETELQTSSEKRQTESSFKSAKKPSSEAVIEETEIGVEESKAEELESVSKSDEKGDEDINGEKSFVPVSEPLLGDEFTATAIVSGKDIYRVDDKSYAYVLKILVPAGDGYSIINHFCSKKIYDGVSSGESVQVTMQLDSNGLVSIVTISK